MESSIALIYQVNGELLKQVNKSICTGKEFEGQCFGEKSLKNAASTL